MPGHHRRRSRVAVLARHVAADSEPLEPLQPDTAAFMAQLAAAPVPAEDPPLAVTRAGFDAMLGNFSDWGVDASAVTCNVVTAPSDDASRPAVTGTRCYCAPGGGAKPVLLYIHGGGWTQGTAEAYGAFTATLCARGGYHVVSVEYRLAPEHPAPAAADDCLTVLRWLANGAPGSGLELDSSKIAICGDSAGGHLTLVTALAARDAGIPIAVQVPLCPVTDCRLGALRDGTSYKAFSTGFLLTEERMEWFIGNYLPNEADRAGDWRASPLLAPSLSTNGLSGLPPTILCTADHDVLRDEGRDMARLLNTAGVQTEYREYAGQVHIFWMFGSVISGAAPAVKQIADDIARHLFG
jgi:acetyl esterase